MTARLRSAILSLRVALRRPRARLALLAFVVLAVGGGWYVTTRGGWVNALRLPPTLDAATPRAQNGWVLEDIQLPGQQQDLASRGFTGFQYKQVDFEASEGWTLKPDTQDAFGLWLTPPPGSVSVTAPFDSGNNTDGKQLSVTARLSTGEILPLEWHLCSQEKWLGPGEIGNHFLFVTLPTGYPDTCRFVDFDVSDQYGHAAHWRIARLPRMRHAVPPPAKVTDTVTKNGITMSVKAWHQQDSEGNGSIETILHPILPPNSHQWDVVVTRQEREWEPFNADGQVRVYSESGMPVLGRNGIFNSPMERWFGGGVRRYGGSAPYSRTTHFLRMSTELRQYETYDESVTFHNLTVQKGKENDAAYFLSLARPLSATTPSGVTVTLPAQGVFNGMASADAINIVVKTSPPINSEPAAYSLSASPLAKTYGKPVQISLTVGPPFHSSGWAYVQGGGPANCAISLHYMTKLPFKVIAPPQVLKSLTFIVHQRVNIQTIPMTFTLPIADRSPPYYPKGYQRPKQ